MPPHGGAAQHGFSGNHSGAFGGFNHGGTARGLSARGHSSFGGGGFHGADQREFETPLSSRWLEQVLRR